MLPLGVSAQMPNLSGSFFCVQTWLIFRYTFPWHLPLPSYCPCSIRNLFIPFPVCLQILVPKRARTTLGLCAFVIVVSVPPLHAWLRVDTQDKTSWYFQCRVLPWYVLTVVSKASIFQTTVKYPALPYGNWVGRKVSSLLFVWHRQASFLPNQLPTLWVH